MAESEAGTPGALAARVVVTVCAAVAAGVIVLALLVGALVAVVWGLRTVNSRFCDAHNGCSDTGQ